MGHEDFTAYVVWAANAPWSGDAAHTNLGVSPREDLARLREVTASQGLMLESVSERLMDTVHGLADQAPGQRLATIEAAGELRIPFTAASWSGSARPRRSGSNPSKRWPRSTSATGTSRR